MAEQSTPRKVKLLCGMISSRLEMFAQARSALKARFGPEDTVSGIYPFDQTDYYQATMGSPLLRQFVSFRWLIDPAELATIKSLTNAMEDDFAQPPQPIARPINLDPGYLTEAKLVLASMKDFAHRIAIGPGVFAEITLQYRRGWQKLPWTFPDYASGRYDDFLTATRDKLRAALHPDPEDEP
jgi:hypothetical protein